MKHKFEEYDKKSRKRMRLIPTFILTILLLFSFVFPSRPVQALSVDEYFTYTYDFVFSKSTVIGTETFYVTVNGSATCIKALPLGASEAFVESSVTANLGGTQVVLNSSYKLTYTEFPHQVGETASVSLQVPLSFPAGSTTGIYNITGNIINARVKILVIWITITGYLPPSQVMGTVGYQSQILGGGGGGGAPAPNPSTNLTAFMDPDGTFLEQAEASSTDKVLKLIFPEGTRFTVPGGIGSSVTIKSIEKDSEPSHAENISIIGHAYNLEPAGSTFTPPARITISYTEDSLPKNASETDVFIAWWNSATNSWVKMKDCAVDQANNSVTALVEHFTIFAAFIDISTPASFEISQLIIEPQSIKSREAVKITLETKNSGGRSGLLTLILKINQTEETRQTISLAAGSTQLVRFEVTKETPTTYYVDVNGLTGVFVVKKLTVTEPAPVPSTSETPPPQEPSPVTSEPPTPTPESAPGLSTEMESDQPDSESFDWQLMFGSIAVGIIAGGLVFLIILWRKKT